jgi:hypothetical protein
MKNPITTTDSQEAFLQACQLRGYDAQTILPDVSQLPEWLQRYTHSSIKRLVIAEAINNGRVRKPGEERVYFPVWDLSDNTSGLGFTYTDCDGWRTGTHVGPRLEFFSYEDAEFFGKNFMDLHRDVVTLLPPVAEPTAA